ncbi:MAG: hypothetical protein HKN20_11025 [Gemmatimonadetes bacterium]|nr:hypothetical protein [Gemmatimonadota bacterium]
MDYVRTAMNSTGRYVPSQIPGTRISSRETRGTGLKMSDQHTRTSESDAAVISISAEGRTHTRESVPRPPDSAHEQKAAPKLEPELSPKEAEQVEELKRRDKEVRAHEQAHLAALGRFRSGAPRYQYETGPDGRRYAVSGNVPVDVSPEATPEETLEKARVIRRSAMAPVPPSLQDFRVAFEAAQMEARARQEMSADPAEAGKSEEGVPIATLDAVPSDPQAEETAGIDFSA